MADVINTLCRERAWAAALALAVQGEIDADLRSLLVKAAARAGAWKEALLLSEGMVNDLELRSLNALLKAVASQEGFQEALKLLSSDPQGSSVQALLGAAVSTAQWQHALFLLHTFPCSDALAVSACGVAFARGRRWKEAVQLVQAHGAGDPALLTAVLNSLAKARRWQLALHMILETSDLPVYNAALHAVDWEWCLLLLAKMRSKDLHPDIFSFGTALTACSREKQWEATLELLQELLGSSMTADAICRGAALRALAQSMVWRFTLQIFTKQRDDIRPLEVFELMSACQGASVSTDLGFLRPLRHRLPMLRPHVTLTGRCQGDGEVSVLADMLRCYGHSTACQIFRARSSSNCPALGARGQLEKEGMQRGERGEDRSDPILFAQVSGPARAQSLRSFLSFSLYLFGGRRTSSRGHWVTSAALRG